MTSNQDSFSMFTNITFEFESISPSIFDSFFFFALPRWRSANVYLKIRFQLFPSQFRFEIWHSSGSQALAPLNFSASSWNNFRSANGSFFSSWIFFAGFPSHLWVSIRSIGALRLAVISFYCSVISKPISFFPSISFLPDWISTDIKILGSVNLVEKIEIDGKK